MSRVEVTQASAPLSEGILQTDLPLDGTPQIVKDQSGTSSTLLLATDETQVNSVLRVKTDNSELLDLEDNGSNNRFNINRNVQKINLDFASKPSDITTQVGAIRTAQDGVNLSDAVKFQENGQVTFTERVKIESDSTVSTQTAAVIEATTTNSSIVLKPNGTGAIIASVPDGTATGGNARGQYAVDLQQNRTANTEVASGDYCVVAGGRRNKATGLDAFVGGGRGNTATSSDVGSVVAGGQSNTANAFNGATVSGGGSNNASSNYSTISGGQSNTASTNTHATVVGGQSNTSSGQFSISGGTSNTASGYGSMAIGGFTSNVASGYGAVAIGGATASATRSVAIGRGTIVSGGDGSIAFMGGTVTDLGGTESLGACAFGRSKTASISGFSFGEDSLSYLRNQFVQSPKNIYSGNTIYVGHSQASQVVAIKSDTLTTAATTVLSLDGSGTTNLIIPNGNNRMWNVQVAWVAVVTAITGTATGVTVGDTKTSTDLLAVAKRGGVTTVSAHTSAGTHAIETLAGSLMAANITYSAGASQEMAITFTGPTFVGGGSVTMRVVARVQLTEVAY